MSKREWYVAVCEQTGEYAGGPPCFEASTIYGPYTREQAEQADAIGEGFPHETDAIVVFKADSRPPFRSLLKTLRAKVAEAVHDDEERAEETRAAQCRR